MAVKDIFDTKYKLWAHIVELVIVIIVIALSGAHMSLATFYTRAEVMGIAMGVKTIVVIMYQILTQHTHKFRRWESLTANMILNILEILFWLVVIILKIQGMQRVCEGIGCELGKAVVVLAFFIFFICIHVAIISFIDRRYFAKHQKPRSSNAAVSQWQY